MVVLATKTHELEMLGTDTEVTWEIPAQTQAITVQAFGSDIKISDVTGMAEPLTAPTWVAIPVTDYFKAGDTYYFTGLKSARLSIVYKYIV